MTSCKINSHVWQPTTYRNRRNDGTFCQCQACGIIGKVLGDRTVAMKRGQSKAFLARVRRAECAAVGENQQLSLV